MRQLSLVGPPLVGKRCLARSVAQQLAEERVPTWLVYAEGDETFDQAFDRHRVELGPAQAGPETVVYCPASGRAGAVDVERLQALAPSYLLVAETPTGLPGEQVYELGPLGVGYVGAPGPRLLIDEVTARRGCAPPEAERDALKRLAMRIGGLPMLLVSAANVLRTLDARHVLPSWVRDGDALWRAVDPDGEFAVRIEAELSKIDEGLRRRMGALSVVEGWFSIETAEALVGPEALETLQALHQSSLLSVVRYQDDALYYVIPGYFGALAARTLDAPVRAVQRRQHAEHFAEAGLAWLQGANDGDVWCRGRLECSHADLVAALERLAEQRRDLGRPGVSAYPMADLELEIMLRVAEGNARVRSRLDGNLADELSALIATAEALDGCKPEVIARGLLALAFDRGRQGLTAERWECLERALRYANRSDDHRLRGVVAHNLAIDANRVDEREAARRYAAMSAHSYAACGNDRGLGRIVELEGLLHQDAGDLTAAQAAFERALTMFRRAGVPSHAGIPLLHLGVLHMTLGHWAKARACLEETTALTEWYGEPLVFALGHLGQAQVAAWLADSDEAETRRAQAFGVIDKVNAQDTRALAQLAWSEALLWLGQAEPAEELARQALAGIESIAYRRRRGEAIGVLALTLWTQGRSDEALPLLERAVEATEATSCRRHAAIARARLGALCAQLGDSEVGAGHLERADCYAEAAPDAKLGEIVRAWRVCGGLLGADALATLWLAGGGAQAAGERFADVALATALRPNAAQMLREALPFAHDGATNVVGPGGSWLVTAHGELVDLTSRPQMAALVFGLASARRRGPGEWVDRDELRELLWPGEAMSESSLSNRLHKTISVLRRDGLGDQLESQGSAYRMRPDVPLSLLPPRVRASK